MSSVVETDTQSRRVVWPANGASNGLSRREVQVISLLLEGLTNKRIAQSLSISEVTVKHHLSHIFRKLGVGSRLELALFAVNNRQTGAPPGQTS